MNHKAAHKPIGLSQSFDLVNMTMLPSPTFLSAFEVLRICPILGMLIVVLSGIIERLRVLTYVTKRVDSMPSTALSGVSLRVCDYIDVSTVE